MPVFKGGVMCIFSLKSTCYFFERSSLELKMLEVASIASVVIQNAGIDQRQVCRGTHISVTESEFFRPLTAI